MEIFGEKGKSIFLIVSILENNLKVEVILMLWI
jgi:hypothetical protein